MTSRSRPVHPQPFVSVYLGSPIWVAMACVTLWKHLQVKMSFDMADADKDGVLTQDEFFEGFSKYGARTLFLMSEVLMHCPECLVHLW